MVLEAGRRCRPSYRNAEKAGEIQDCAALLRYSYRESLKAHDAGWAQAQHVGDVPHSDRYASGDIRRRCWGLDCFGYDQGRLWRGMKLTEPSLSFQPDAHALMSWNTYLVGRSVRAAKPGDLIFFRQLEENSTYHSMVITGSDADWVVYHTGPNRAAQGGDAVNGACRPPAVS